MRYSLSLLVTSAGLALASQSSFSVHDDLLAYPQYEVVFSDTFISEYEAEALISGPLQSNTPPASSKDVEFQNSQKPLGEKSPNASGVGEETYETLVLHDQEYLCSIPVVEIPPRNETSEAEKRAEEQKELVRATDRGWELLKDLDGTCLYFISGWWSYSFCYNKDVTQFHQLPMPPGKGGPPSRDPSTAQYVLGRALGSTDKNEDDYGNDLEVRKAPSKEAPLHTEIQVKGDTRYLVQRLEGGTTCDLTGKPRRIEIQYHCSAQANDRIGWIKEVTTCSYIMVVYTPRLCGDVAFQPPKEVKANAIACRMVVPEDEVAYWSELKTLEGERIMRGGKEAERPINVGGVIVGGHKHVGEEGNRLPLPANFAGVQPQVPIAEIIARAKAKVDGGKVEVLSDEALQQMDLEPKVIEQLKKELEKLSGDKGWRLEVIEVPGDTREIRGIVDGDDDDEPEVQYVAQDDAIDGSGQKVKERVEEEEEEAGSEETYKEEL